MKRRRVIALLLAAAMVLGGCGGGGDAKDGSVPNAGSQAPDGSSAEVDLSEKLTYSIFAQADDVPDPEGLLESSPVLNYWQDMFNIDIEWQLPPQGSESDQLTLMFGTGDYTDIIDMSFSTENLGTLCDDGAIYDLTPYIDQYMPNYRAFLEANSDVKSALYDDSGRIYTLAVIQEAPAQWGGLVYRRDILETMTGGNVAFPSGSEEPATIEDWEYMLELMTQYFQAAGFEEYAGLILPACGYFATGELMSGFGIGGLDYITADGKAAYGIADDNFYNYLVKMNEWYKNGYIYSDFASRSQDLFYLPNTALTYGGSAGVWYGITQQLGDSMSLPEYELYMQVNPLSAPVDSANGITAPLGVFLDAGRASTNSGWSVSTACSEEKLARILTAFDYFYSDDGAATRSMGLSAEQGAADWEDYTSVGLVNGTRENGSKVWTKEMDSNAELEIYAFAENRMPGIVVDYETRTCDLNDAGLDLTTIGDMEWTKNGRANVYPLAVSFTPEESEQINTISTNIQDYANTMIVNFIMGREELTPESFAAYQAQLESLGLSDYLAVKQAAYERYLQRADQ